MKIGVNALFMIPGEVGGSETYLRKTLHAAAADNPHHEFTVFANSESRNVFARDLAACQNVTLVDMHVRAASRPRRVLCEQRDLPRVVAARGLDVLWNAGNTAPISLPCPQVTSIYDMQFMHFPEDFSRAGLFFTKLFTRLSLKHSALILAISGFSREEISRHPAARMERIRVTPLAADPAFAAPMHGDIIAERVLALTHAADPYILIVANTYPHKSVETAVEAFGRISHTIPHRLVIVGQPRLGEPAVAEAIADLPEGAQVVRLGHVSANDLVALYQGADLFVFPSKYEGFGLPVLEAMYSGVPVVALREGSVPEVGADAISYAQTGSVESLASEMSRLLAMEPDARAGIVAKARLRAAGFSWNETARLTVAALEEAVAGEFSAACLGSAENGAADDGE